MTLIVSIAYDLLKLENNLKASSEIFLSQRYDAKTLLKVLISAEALKEGDVVANVQMTPLCNGKPLDGRRDSNLAQACSEQVKLSLLAFVHASLKICFIQRDHYA